MVQMAYATRDDVIASTSYSIHQSIKGYPGSEPLVALCFSCCNRKQVLGSRVNEESLTIQKSYPSLPIAGFYTYGEIAPLERNRPTRFHNNTFVNLVMGLQ